MRRGAADQRTVKDHNATLVLNLVAEAGRQSRDGGPTRAQLATAAGLTRATTGDIVDRLIAAGLVRELAPARGARGRPGSPLRLDGEGAIGLGAEINVDYVSVCAVDFTGAVLDNETVPTDNRARPAEQAIAHSAHLVNQVVGRLSDRRRGRVAGVTLAVPGLVDTDGLVRRAPNLAQWADVPAARILGERLGRWAEGIETRVDNEANLAAQAQLWFGSSGPGLRHFVHVSGEIGIGAGIVVDGEVFRGVRGYAGELGHVVVAPDGPRCHCGGAGCLEQIAGQDALLLNAGLDPHQDSLLNLATLAGSGDARALHALHVAGAALGQALAAVSNLFDIPTVVLGGSYGRLAPWLRPGIQSQLDRQVTSRPWAATEVIVSGLDRDAAVRGAAGAVISSVLNRAQFAAI